MPKASLAAMKHLSRKHKIALVELVVLVLLVVWFIAPRPLARAMAGGTALTPLPSPRSRQTSPPSRGRRPDAHLLPGRAGLFPAHGPAPVQAVHPLLPGPGCPAGVTLGYRVDLTFSQGRRPTPSPLTGDRAIVMGGDGGTKTYQVTDSDAFQQSVLDFLLEQEYTKEETP